MVPEIIDQNGNPLPSNQANSAKEKDLQLLINSVFHQELEQIESIVKENPDFLTLSFRDKVLEEANAGSADCFTVLGYAVTFGKNLAIDCLVKELRADPNLPGQDGQLPLHHLIRVDFYEHAPNSAICRTASQLVALGADPDKKTSYESGLSPREFANKLAPTSPDQKRTSSRGANCKVVFAGGNEAVSKQEGEKQYSRPVTFSSVLQYKVLPLVAGGAVIAALAAFKMLRK